MSRPAAILGGLALLAASASVFPEPQAPAGVPAAVTGTLRGRVEFLRMQAGLPGSATDAGKTARIGMHPCKCRNVTVLAGQGERAVQQASRFIDFPERPQD